MMLKVKEEGLGQQGNAEQCHQPTWKKDVSSVSARDRWVLTVIGFCALDVSHES